uniref:Lipoprotein n=1 Tax=Rhabditophanes sp. KR3021 TaxID=114890 RepID=A0AC35TYY3_9BILA
MMVIERFNVAWLTIGFMLFAVGSCQRDELTQTAGEGAKFVGDILKLFVDREQQQKSPSSGLPKESNIFSAFQSQPPQHNKPAPNLFSAFVPQQSQQAKSNPNMLGPFNLQPQKSNAKENDETWGVLAKQMLNMFGPPTTTPPPKPTNFLTDTLGKYLGGFMNGGDNKNQPKETNLIEKNAEDRHLLFGNWANLFDKGSPTPNNKKIDTGDGNFDRFVIREKTNGESFLDNLVGSKWNERGLQWTDGNLKLVNKKGKDILGSEVAVHDTSIDIPMQQWLNIAGNLLGTVADQVPQNRKYY